MKMGVKTISIKDRPYQIKDLKYDQSKVSKDLSDTYNELYRIVAEFYKKFGDFEALLSFAEFESRKMTDEDKANEKKYMRLISSLYCTCEDTLKEFYPQEYERITD